MKLFETGNFAGTAILVGWAALAHAQAAPPQPTPAAQAAPAIQFPSAVELVTVDAVVTDKKNVPIESLTKDSFRVFEDGKPQEIASFEAVILPPAPPQGAPRLRRISSNQSAELRTGRTFIIVFDDIHLQPFQSNRAKAAIDQFLKTGTRDGDRITLLASGGGAWWSTRMPEGYKELSALLKRLEGREIPETGQDRITEWEAMRIHIYRDKQVEERVARRFETYGVNSGGGRDQNQSGGNMGFDGDPMVQGRAAEVYYQATTKNKITLDTLERALSSLAGAKGRKSLILVGQGFIYDPNLDEFKDVVQASRRGNCAIYFVDTMGLGGMPVAMTAEYGPAIDSQDIGAAFAENLERSEGAESVAIDSGGFTVKNSNDLNKGLQRIADETRVYYLLGYNPTNAARDGKFRKIEVKVNGKDMRIRARKGYYAPLDGVNKKDDKKKAQGGPDPQFQEALDSPYEMPGIPIRLTSYVFDETLLGKASAILHADVDLSAFTFNEKEGRYSDTLEFLLVVAHRETGEFNRYDQKIDMNLRPETKAKYAQTWFPIQRDFELLPGGYQAKIVIRDKNALKVGTVIHEFEVPDLATWRISTPVLTDSIQPTPAGQAQGPPKLIMLARREFETGARLFMQFDVYNPTKDKATGMPKVTAGYTIRRKSDGQVFLKVPATMIQPTSLGRLSRMVGPPLDGADPGDYEFELNLKDELSDKILDYKEDFVVVPKGVQAAAGVNQN